MTEEDEIQEERGLTPTSGPSDLAKTSMKAPKFSTIVDAVKPDVTVERQNENDSNFNSSEEAFKGTDSVFSEEKRNRFSAVKNESISKNPAAKEFERRSSSGLHIPGILTLPMDALHCVASFLKPTEWYEFGQANRATHRVCREIVRRVRMHGFKCATEIVSAWKLGHHEDAKELAALYISEGVPIYPQSLGHSYHTILWRMQTEASQEENEGSKFEVDKFFHERADFRTNHGSLGPDMTYVELKSLFWMQKEEEGNPQTRTRTASLRNRDISPQELVESRSLATSGAGQDLPARKKKLHLTVHQHLLDQHLLCRESIDDQEGTMVTPPVSLSADFYHTHPSARRHSRTARFRPEGPQPPVFGATQNIAARDHAANEVNLAPFPQNDQIDPHPFAQGVLPARRHQAPLPLDDDLFEPHHQQSPFKDHPVMDLLDLEAYSAASVSVCKTEISDDPSTYSVESPLQCRFDNFHRRLESFLARGNSAGFDECILDFWDEHFPSSAGFHYYDRHTAVPRISSMRYFLTKPCPKAVGIVQCEIERIKTPSRGKGVNMKGRLFPTYEYRLFIRNRPRSPLAESAVLEEEDDFVRRDTVLMVAKNRGRRRSGSGGVIPTSPPKKGSNNYYLQMPHQIDVDAHFNKVNGDGSSSKLTPNGASHDPVIASSDSTSSLLGRLQSNFIGTEFQIFTPRLRKNPGGKMKPVYSPSDDELDYDSGFSSDNNSTRRSRFGRLSLRRSPTSADVASNERSRNNFFRTSSSPDMTAARQGRAKLRAIANTPEAQQQQDRQEPVLCEVEDGVITYTANLLGSRPRIMDVCIPKVSSDGEPGAEWRQFLESNEELEDSDMLSAFRQLLQRIEQQDQNPTQMEDAEDDENETEEVDSSGLLVLQNRPPWWNMELGSFVLNFGGRVSVASVKNFQLCDRHDQDKILLQFGRIQGRHSFTMDFQHPLTAVQAFSIAISSLQSKISFG